VRIALFVTCVADTLYPEVGRATVSLLERLGHDVSFPARQTCCGQLHLNSGHRDEARLLARRLIAALRDYEAVVSPSSSCVGAIREAYPSLAAEVGDTRLERDARELGARTFELSEFLVRRLGLDDVGASFPQRVTYHSSCHSLRVARIGDAPLRLLRRVRGLELVELPRAEECCGFGGTFAVKNADVSLAMLADKCDGVIATGAEYCAGVDASCLLHIGGGLSRRGAVVRTIHLAEILASGARPGASRR